MKLRWKLLSPNDLGEFMLVEHCQKLNIIELTKQAKGQLLESLLNAKISATEQGISLTTTNCYFGGQRYWLVCPKCERRAGVLYKKPTGDLLLCRKCHNLKYIKSRYNKMI